MLWRDKVNKIADMNSFSFLKILLINIMILYNISIHTLFHSDSFILSVCLSSFLSVDLKVILGIIEMSRNTSQQGIFIKQLLAQWVGLTLNHSLFCIFVLLNL